MMYEYALSKGLNKNQAKGLIANIHRESTFRPGVVGDNGNSFGLFQWNTPSGRGGPFKAAVPDWKTNWKGQIDYALKEDVGPQYKGATEGMSAREAAYWWMDKWERPADRAGGDKKHAGFLASYKFQKGGQVGQAVRGITKLSKKVDLALTRIRELESSMTQSEAGMGQPIVISGGDEGGQTSVHSAHTGNNLPMYNIPSRDSCPLSMYYQYNPSFNPRGIGA